MPALPGADIGLNEAPGNTAVSVLATVFVLFLLLSVFLLGIIPATKWTRRRARLRRLANGDIAAAWEVIVAELTDLDRPVDPAATPNETAEEVGTALQPLASVYTKSLYGPEEPPTAAELNAASRSLTVTEERLRSELPRSERVAALYRVRSLLGGRWLSRWLPWPRP